MLYGGVVYRLKAEPEKDVHVPWAGRVVFAPQQENGDIKIQFYQVYLVRVVALAFLRGRGWRAHTNERHRTPRHSLGRNRTTILRGIVYEIQIDAKLSSQLHRNAKDETK